MKLASKRMEGSTEGMQIASKEMLVAAEWM
jgi:hypothetical protein